MIASHLHRLVLPHQDPDLAVLVVLEDLHIPHPPLPPRLVARALVKKGLTKDEQLCADLEKDGLVLLTGGNFDLGELNDRLEGGSGLLLGGQDGLRGGRGVEGEGRSLLGLMTCRRCTECKE